MDKQLICYEKKEHGQSKHFWQHENQRGLSQKKKKQRMLTSKYWQLSLLPFFPNKMGKEAD